MQSKLDDLFFALTMNKIQFQWISFWWTLRSLLVRLMVSFICFIHICGSSCERRGEYCRNKSEMEWNKNQWNIKRIFFFGRFLFHVIIILFRSHSFSFIPNTYVGKTQKKLSEKKKYLRERNKVWIKKNRCGSRHNHAYRPAKCKLWLLRCHMVEGLWIFLRIVNARNFGFVSFFFIKIHCVGNMCVLVWRFFFRCSFIFTSGIFLQLRVCGN